MNTIDFIFFTFVVPMHTGALNQEITNKHKKLEYGDIFYR